MTTFDRPIEATLQVKLADGSAWDATPEDLERFGYVKRLDAYVAFDDHLREALHSAGLIRRDTTEARLNPLRYIVELAICHPGLLAHREVQETTAEVVALERHLQATLPEEDR